MARRLLVACGKPTASGDWKKRLNDHRHALKKAVHKGDHSAVHKRVYSASWLASIQCAKAVLNRKDTNALEKIVQDGNELNKQVADTAHDQVAQLQGTPPDEKKWKEKLEEAREKAKKDSMANIDKVFDQGVSYIDTNIPPGEQDAAATVFMAGSDLLSIGFDFLTQQLLGAFESLGNFLKNIWDQVSNYANGIVSVASNIGNAIASIFG